MDRELVDRAKTGDMDSFDLLFRRYERSVLAVVQADVRDPQLAENVVRKTLLRAYRRLPLLPDDAAFGPWLLNLARRQSIELIRRIPIPAGAGASTVDEPPTDASGDDGDAGWIEDEHMLGLVSRLPADERQLIGLRYFDNHTPTEIARVVGRPLDQINQQISLAVTRLKFWWEQEHDL